MSRFALRRLVSAALLLPLVTLSLATGGLWLRCRFTGAVAPACCCPAGGAEGAAAPEPARASEQDCCDRLITPAADEMPFEPVTGPLAEDAPGLVWAGVLPASAGSADHLLLPTSPSLVARARSAPTPPPEGRARLVAKSSFLI